LNWNIPAGAVSAGLTFGRNKLLFLNRLMGGLWLCRFAAVKMGGF
jgi:hypothetical protein